ncbi:MAG TPA: DNA ligase D [Sphingobacteriaceae bacterium]
MLVALEEYKKKRSFSQTPEPAGGLPAAEDLLFVIQKHHASHLHYDFRLELKGVLKSWAVPKGPSMNPEDHRLAQAVEDHPFDYKDFEGIIPKGQYGAGTVIIWDRGTYEPDKKFRTKKEKEHYLMSSYYKGRLLIRLNGSKLKGRFELLKKPERGENSWILSKADDRFNRKGDILKKDASVVSGLTLDQMAANQSAARWQSNRNSDDRGKEADVPPELRKRLSRGEKKPHPGPIDPMLATLVREPFDDPDWLFEVKFDGYRVQAHAIRREYRLYSRSRLDYTDQYAAVAEELQRIGHEVILDGEVVLLNDRGHPDFDGLQRYNGTGHLVYFAFDLLWIDGYDITALPLTERKEILRLVLPESDVIRYSTAFPQGRDLFDLVREQGVEGIVAKRKDSPYRPGRRSAEWLKIPARRIQEFVLGGWTESESGRGFRSLIFGNYVDGRLEYVGHAGHGFKDQERKEILAVLKKLAAGRSPFSGDVRTSTAVHWLRPELVISVEFATFTRAGNIRKPATFRGFRPDKDPREVVPEIPLSAQEEQSVIRSHQPEPPPSVREESPDTMTASNWPEIEKLQITSENMLPVEGTEVRVTNIEKSLWSEAGVTKADLIRYYISVREFILPYLVNRPLSLHLKPYGPTAPGLYIKDMEGRKPPYAKIFRMARKHPKPGKRAVIEYLLCQNLATLIYIINLGAVDLNPWSSRTNDYEHPDWITIDLDPSDDDFGKAVEAARAARSLFEELGLTSFVKTSGKTGLHLLVPCRELSFPQARKLGEYFCDEIHTRVPHITTRERAVSGRGNRLYVDDSQNDLSDTIASAYSVRPFRVPSVSTPLQWEEVKPGLDPTAFQIDTILPRLEKTGDLLGGLFDEKAARNNLRVLRKFL